MLAACMNSTYRMRDSRRRLFFAMRKARGLQCNNHVVVDDGYLPMFRNLTVNQAQGVKGLLEVGFFRNSLDVDVCTVYAQRYVRTVLTVHR